MKFYQRHAQCILCQTNVNFVGRQAKVPRDEAMAAYEEAIVAAPQEQVAHLEECRMAVCLDAIRRIKERGVTGVVAAGSLSSPAALGPSGPSAKPRRTGKAVGQGAQAGRGDRINEAPCLGLLMLLQACRTDLDELEA